MNSDIKGHYQRATEIVEGNATVVERVAAALLEQREVTGEALAELLAMQSIANHDRTTEILAG